MDVVMKYINSMKINIGDLITPLPIEDIIQLSEVKTHLNIGFGFYSRCQGKLFTVVSETEKYYITESKDYAGNKEISQLYKKFFKKARR